MINLKDKILFGLADKIGLLNQLENKSHERLFNEIIGHNDIKRILKNAIHSKKPVHVLLVGSPGSAKTMFLIEIKKLFKESLFMVGSSTSKAGLLNQLFEIRPRFVLVDELDKMSLTDQTSLLDLMEIGYISETKMNKTRQMTLVSWVFASANSYQKISEPLLSRFIVLIIPEYSFGEFAEIVVRRLKKEDIDEKTAFSIAQKVWYELGSKDIRDAVKVGRLAKNIQETGYVIEIMKSYSAPSKKLDSKD